MVEVLYTSQIQLLRVENRCRSTTCESWAVYLTGLLELWEEAPRVLLAQDLPKMLRDALIEGEM